MASPVDYVNSVDIYIFTSWKMLNYVLLNYTTFNNGIAKLLRHFIFVEGSVVHYQKQLFLSVFNHSTFFNTHC